MIQRPILGSNEAGIARVEYDLNRAALDGRELDKAHANRPTCNDHGRDTSPTKVCDGIANAVTYRATLLPENFASKLGAWDPERGWIPVTYRDCFQKQSISGVNRILIATSGSTTQLLTELLPFFSQPYRLVYLLVTPPEGFEPMKYEANGVDQTQIIDLFERFQTFLESDARHHLWIHSEGGRGTLICDEHDWIYVYGNLEAVEQFLLERGFKEEMPTIPFPHLHNESNANDPQMEALLKHFDWKAQPVSNLG